MCNVNLCQIIRFSEREKNKNYKKQSSEKQCSEYFVHKSFIQITYKKKVYHLSMEKKKKNGQTKQYPLTRRNGPLETWKIPIAFLKNVNDIIFSKKKTKSGT